MRQGYAPWISGAHRASFTPYHIGTFLDRAKSLNVNIAVGKYLQRNMLRRIRVLLFPYCSVPVVWDCIWVDVVRDHGAGGSHD